MAKFNEISYGNCLIRFNEEPMKGKYFAVAVKGTAMITERIEGTTSDDAIEQVKSFIRNTPSIMIRGTAQSSSDISVAQLDFNAVFGPDVRDEEDAAAVKIYTDGEIIIMEIITQTIYDSVATKPNDWHKIHIKNINHKCSHSDFTVKEVQTHNLMPNGRYVLQHMGGPTPLYEMVLDSIVEDTNDHKYLNVPSVTLSCH